MSNEAALNVIIKAHDENTAKVAAQASENIRKIGTAGAQSAREQQALQQALDNLQRKVNPLGAAIKEAEINQRALNKAWLEGRITAKDYTQGVEFVKKQLDATKASLANAQNLGKSAKEISFAMRQVPMQFTDIVVGLSSGQSPLQVLLQQGGQLKDLFGGIGPAVKAIGGYLVSSLLSPLGLVTAGVIAGTAAWKIWGDSGESSAKRILDKLEKANPNLIKSIEEYRKSIADASKQKLTLDIGQLESRRLLLQQQLDKLKEDYRTSLNPIGRRSALEPTGEIATTQAEINKVNAQINAAKQGLNNIEEFGDSAFKKFLGNTSYMTEQQRVLSELTKVGEEYRAAWLSATDQAQRDLALERARQAIAQITGKVEKDSLNERIQGYQKLRGDMVKAFEAAGKAAQDATRKADEFLQRAAQTRQGAQDKLLDRQIGQASPEEADALRNQAINEALDRAHGSKIDADYQRLQGNNDAAEKSLELADDQIRRAEQLANALRDEGLAYQQIQDVAEASAQIDESRAAIEQQRAEKSAQDQQDLAKQIDTNDKLLAATRARLDEIEGKLKQVNETPLTVKTDDSQLDVTLGKLQRIIEFSKDTPNFTGAYDSEGRPVYRDPIPARADGGILPGRSPHDRADNLLFWGTAGEGVVNRPAMRHYGKAWLDAVNRMELPKYASGGILSRISIPSMPAPSMASGASSLHRGTFVLDGQHYQVQAAPDVFDQLTRRSLQVRIRR